MVTDTYTRGIFIALLDRRLTGKKFKVFVNGGEHQNKEMIVSVFEGSDRRCVIRFSHYNRVESLPCLLAMRLWSTSRIPIVPEER